MKMKTELEIAARELSDAGYSCSAELAFQLRVDTGIYLFPDDDYTTCVWVIVTGDGEVLVCDLSTVIGIIDTDDETLGALAASHGITYDEGALYIPYRSPADLDRFTMLYDDISKSGFNRCR